MNSSLVDKGWTFALLCEDIPDNLNYGNYPHLQKLYCLLSTTVKLITWQHYNIITNKFTFGI